MPSQVSSPSVGVNDTTLLDRGRPWSNPGNIISSNDQRATRNLPLLNDDTDGLRASGFAFDIPQGVEILGIQVRNERHGVRNVVDSRVQLRKSDGTWHPHIKGDGVNTWESTDTVKSYGGSNDKWNREWTPDEINSPNFGAGLVAQAAQDDATAHVDHMEIEVWYSNDPPFAPTLHVRDNFDAIEAAQFTWDFNDPDPEDSQSAFQLIIERVSDSLLVHDSGKVAATVAAHDLLADTLANDEEYRWKVRTWDSFDDVGPYSDWEIFTCSAAPSVTITDPATNGEVISSSSHTVAWSFSDPESEGQSAYQIVVRDDGGGLHSDSGKVLSSLARSHEITDLPNNQVGWSIEVTVWDAQDIASDVATRTFDISFDPPPTPSITVVGHDSQGHIAVNIENLDTQAGEVDATHNDVYRRLSGSSDPWSRIATLVPLDASFRDFTVASQTSYEYRVTTVSEITTTADSEVASGSIELEGMWLHDVSDPLATAHQFFFDGGGRQASRSVEAARMQFAGRELPVTEFGEHSEEGVTVRLSTFADDGDLEALRAFVQRRSVLAYRDERGRKVFGTAQELPEEDKLWGAGVQVQIEAVSFPEEV